MKFLFGVAIGAVGMWAYSSGKLQGLMGQASGPVNQAFTVAGERASEVANNPQVRRWLERRKTRSRISRLHPRPNAAGSPGQRTRRIRMARRKQTTEVSCFAGHHAGQRA